MFVTTVEKWSVYYYPLLQTGKEKGTTREQFALIQWVVFVAKLRSGQKTSTSYPRLLSVIKLQLPFFWASSILK